MSEQTNTVVSPSPIVSSDERLMAALAHGSVILSFFGPIVPALVWTFQRYKSPYVAFHALQAIGYQMLTFWVGMAAYLLFVPLVTLLAIPLTVLAGRSESVFEMTPFALQGSMFLFMFGFMGAYLFFGIAGAILCLLDKDFKYPILGKRLAKYLGRGTNPNDSLDETKEEQWMAGMEHASAILMLWGLFTPLAIWLTQKDSSPRLRFQSIQAVIYQLLAVVGYFGFMALYMFMFMALFIGAALASGNPQGSASAILLIVFLVVILAMMLIVALVMPAYHLFAMIASLQIIKGRDYRYPLIGRWLARRLGNS